MKRRLLLLIMLSIIGGMIPQTVSANPHLDEGFKIIRNPNSKTKAKKPRVVCATFSCCSVSGWGISIGITVITGKICITIDTGSPRYANCSVAATIEPGDPQNLHGDMVISISDNLIITDEEDGSVWQVMRGDYPAVDFRTTVTAQKIQ